MYAHRLFLNSFSQNEIPPSVESAARVHTIKEAAMRWSNSRYGESAQPVRPRTPSRSSPGQCREEHRRWKDEVEELPGAVGICTDVDRVKELPHALGHSGEESNALTYPRGRSVRRCQDKNCCA